MLDLTINICQASVQQNVNDVGVSNSALLQKKMCSLHIFIAFSLEKAFLPLVRTLKRSSSKGNA